jgi:hypothetical protein
MPKIPLGDVLRAFLPWNWLKLLKGTSIKSGDWEILLNEKKGGLTHEDPAPFNKPHKL